MVTTDRNIRHQQNLAGRGLAILILPTTSWPRLLTVAARIAEFAASLKSGEVREFPPF